jgi:hypothetical protein
MAQLLDIHASPYILTNCKWGEVEHRHIIGMPVSYDISNSMLVSSRLCETKPYRGVVSSPP